MVDVCVSVRVCYKDKGVCCKDKGSKASGTAKEG